MPFLVVRQRRLLTYFSCAVDIANALNPLFPGICKGEPGAGKDVPPHVVYNNDKVRRVFGFKFREAGETYKDVFDDFARRGWKAETGQ